MTRTERNFNPRAIIKDRSESKTGLDKSDRKGGAGAHNWGSMADEQEHEFRAAEDYEEEEDGLAITGNNDVRAELGAAVSEDHKPQHDGSVNERRSSVVSEEERQQAREFRAKALKEGSDLGAIARTSAAVSSSPPGPSTTVTVATDAQTEVVP